MHNLKTRFVWSLNTTTTQLNPEEIIAAWQSYKVLHIHISDLYPETVQPYYNQLLPKIGTPYALAEDVTVGDRYQQRTGKVWMEVRFDPQYPDAYRHSANAQPLHTDGSYIADFPNATLMCCVANATQGGETIFLDAEQLVQILEIEAPELLIKLKQTIIPHTRSGDSRNLPILRHQKDGWYVNWNYYCMDTNADPQTIALGESFQQFLLTNSSIKQALVPIKLQPGDAVIWKDDRLLHGRNNFSATLTGERYLWKCAVDVGVFSL